MLIIKHRQNCSSDLSSLDTSYGAEIDIRSDGAKLYIHHDPFKEGESLSTWLSSYRHGKLILNVKEEGLESSIIALLQTYDITDYFFLDQSFPFIQRYKDDSRIISAVRVSEYEPLITPILLSNYIKWLWVDYFTCFPLNLYEFKYLQSLGFSLCLVSPELQGHSLSKLQDLKFFLSSNRLNPEAVCTKFPELWLQ